MPHDGATKALRQGFYRCLQVVSQGEYVYSSGYVFIKCISKAWMRKDTVLTKATFGFC